MAKLFFARAFVELVASRIECVGQVVRHREVAISRVIGCFGHSIFRAGEAGSGTVTATGCATPGEDSMA